MGEPDQNKSALAASRARTGMPAGGRLSRGAAARLVLIVVSALAAGGAAGFGVSAGLWSPLVAVSLSVAIGLAAGILVFRSARTARRESRGGR